MLARIPRWAPGLIALLLLAAGTAAAKPVRVDGGTITYAVEHRFKSFEGCFAAADLALELDWGDGDLAGLSFVATIPLGTLDSGNQLRDEHALEALEEFLYPEATWTVDKVEVVSVSPGKGDWTSATLRVSGPLTLHGVTEVLTVEVTAERAGDTVALRGSFPLSLAAFGVERPGLLGFKIGDTVTVNVALEAPAP